MIRAYRLTVANSMPDVSLSQRLALPDRSPCVALAASLINDIDHSWLACLCPRPIISVFDRRAGSEIRELREIRGEGNAN